MALEVEFPPISIEWNSNIVVIRNVSQCAILFVNKFFVFVPAKLKLNCHKFETRVTVA